MNGFFYHFPFSPLVSPKDDNLILNADLKHFLCADVLYVRQDGRLYCIYVSCCWHKGERQRDQASPRVVFQCVKGLRKLIHCPAFPHVFMFDLLQVSSVFCRRASQLLRNLSQGIRALQIFVLGNLSYCVCYSDKASLESKACHLSSEIHGPYFLISLRVIILCDQPWPGCSRCRASKTNRGSTEVP